MDVADSAEEPAPSSPQARIACLMSPCAANTPGQLTLRGAAFSKSSEEKCQFAAPNTFHACKGVAIETSLIRTTPTPD